MNSSWRLKHCRSRVKIGKEVPFLVSAGEAEIEQ